MTVSNIIDIVRRGQQDAAQNSDKAKTMALPKLHPNMSDDELDGMMKNAREATKFMKALAHEGRLMTLCYLSTGEKSVTELEELLSSRQAAVSQQLTRLRLEGLVDFRRDGKTIYYRLADDRARQMLEMVYAMFCADGED
jgi:ArsR family transcriptional regulator